MDVSCNVPQCVNDAGGELGDQLINEEGCAVLRDNPAIKDLVLTATKAVCAMRARRLVLVSQP
jgi:hypothetical protein